MTMTLILLGIAALILFYGIGIYNRLVKLRAHVEEAWSSIDVQLKKRYNLIPNLVETIKGYAKHERETFDSVTQARTAAQKAGTVEDQIAAEKKLNNAMMNLFAVAENYPELKSNQNFLQLQDELSDIESDIEKSRRYYNGTVRNNNIAIESFPSNLIASSFHFEEFIYFEIEDESQRANPEVKF